MSEDKKPALADKPTDASQHNAADNKDATLTSEEKRSGEEIALMKLLDNLTMAQKVALSEIGRYGYNLKFIRRTDDGTMAIAMAEGKVMTIDDEGEIEPNPDIVIRK